MIRLRTILLLASAFLLINTYFLLNTEHQLTSTLDQSERQVIQVTPTPSVSEPRILKVGTFNIWNFKNDWKSRLAKIARIIVGQKAHIVGLQEVRRDLIHEENDQFEFMKSCLSTEFPYSTFKEATRMISDGGEQEEGLAIFSKFPITSTDFLEYKILQGDTDTNHRIALCVVIEFFSTSVNFCVTHISYADIVQCRQASELLQFVNERYASSGVTLIVGDLNTYIDYEYPIELLTRNMLPSSRCKSVWEQINFDYNQQWNIVFHDVWKVLHPTEKGFTFISNTPGLDSCRPDRILASNSKCWKDASISIAETLLPNNVMLSDHKALFADFLFTSEDCT